MSEVTWDGAFNLSDLGGIPTEQGGTTKTGRLYRSGSPEFLTEDGWRQAQADGLTTVVDLRNPNERGRGPAHPVVDEAVSASVTQVNIPTDEPDDPEFQRVCLPFLDSPRSYSDQLAMYPHKFAQVFRAIAEPVGGTLINCAGGRDRTGMVVAMLLRLAGVAPAEIGKDYSASVRRVNAELVKRPDFAPGAEMDAATLDAWLAPREAAMVQWISGFDVAAYLRDAGLQPDEIEKLRLLLA